MALDPNARDNYWSSGPFPHPSEYPKWMYHDTELPQQVRNPIEQQALEVDGKWSPNYSDHPQAYPKTKFRAITPETEGGIWYEMSVVANPEEDAALGAEWTDTMPPDPSQPPPEPPPETQQAKSRTRR